MVSRTAATVVPHPDAVEFVRFCYHRRKVGWPELYDEMCAVAGRGLFRGLSADDLGGIGVGFSLFYMPTLASLACRVVAEEAALRRPVSVVLRAATGEPAPDATRTTADAARPAADAARPAADAARPAPIEQAHPTDDRTADVPVRLVLAPSGV